MTLTRIKASKNLALLRFEAETAIDAAAEAVRRRFATSGKHQIYADKRDEAERLIKAVSTNQALSVEDYPYLVAESQDDEEIISDVAAMTALAQTWLAMDKFWKKAAARVERVTIRAKARARQSNKQADLDAIVEQARADLSSIGTPLPERPKQDTPGNNPTKPPKSPKTGESIVPGPRATPSSPGDQ